MIGGLHLFFIGLTASFGPCLLFCTPVVFPLILSYERRFLFIFLLTRLVTFLFLSLLAFTLGKILLHFLNQYRNLLFIAAGLFILSLSLWLIFKGGHLFCPRGSFQWRSKYLTSIFLGIIFGLLPCAPSLAVLTYITLEGKNYFHSGLLGFAFGSGETASPLLFTFFLRSLLLPRITSYKWIRIIQYISAVLLFFIGIRILLKGI